MKRLVSIDAGHSFACMDYVIGGGFEGDMILPDGFDPTSESNGKGVAIYGPRQWPNNIIPYDISSITSKIDLRNLYKLKIVANL